MDKDLIVIGGGPGGYVTAIRAAQLGAKVVLIEQHSLGGTCLHWGCIPTKALYKSAEVMNTLRKADQFGLNIQSYSLDMRKVQSRKQEIVARLHAGINQLMKIHRIQVITGKARLLDSSTVEVTPDSGIPEELTAQHIVIATGSKAAAIPVPGADLPGVLTSTEVLELDAVPEKMIIIGGGVIGMEFAGIFQSFGAQVSVLELLPRILPTADEEIVKRMNPLLKKQGLRIETGVNVREIRQTPAGLTVFAQGKKETQLELSGDIVLIAAGRSPNTGGLGLEEADIRFSRKGIEVDAMFATSVPGIYAIGDVIGGQMLAHVASHQGTILAENLFGRRKADRRTAGSRASSEFDSFLPVVPACVFSFPEAAWVGFTEDELKTQNIPYCVSKSMFGANGKALTMGEGEGLIKVLAGKQDNKILGVHILGPHASDLIHEAALAIQQGLRAEAVISTVHAHPTLTEAFQEACQALGGAEYLE